jgi:repressor LexA
MNLTHRQQQILDFIRQHTVQNGPPSLWEIAQAFGMRQTGGVRKHLQVLEKKGCLSLVAGTARGIRLPADDAKPVRTDRLLLPILGRVAAGAPIGAAQDLDELTTLSFEYTLFSPQPDYLLRVQGDSMRDDGILAGDLVAVRRSDTAENGQTVVARIDGEITIKRLQRVVQGGHTLHIQLLPRNPDYAAIVVPADADFAVIGLYCGLVRRA